MLKLGCCFPPY